MAQVGAVYVNTETFGGILGNETFSSSSPWLQRYMHGTAGDLCNCVRKAGPQMMPIGRKAKA
jgi:hypothetical protein